MKDFTQIRKVGGEYYQSFLDAGYKEYTSDANHLADSLLSKRIYKGDKHLYSIMIYCYDWSRHHQRGGNPFSIQSEVQFNQSTSGTFDVIYHNSEARVSEIEEFFNRVYVAMECQ